ncbi:MAG: FAD-dependent oxidoreductase, partial [Myxococcaceae bacterium]
MMWSRRELVTAFLGAGVAAAGCRRAEHRAPVPGALVDRAVETGHLLRDASRPAPAADVRAVDVLIVGGGIAGLSAAWRLRAAGVDDLLLVELDEDLGGTSRSGRNPVSAYPWGAHYLPAPLESHGPVPRLLRELGALVGEDEDGHPRFAEQMLIRQPDERLFYKGLWYEGLYLRAGASTGDLAELARFEAQIAQLSAARDGRGRKAFAVPTALSSDDAEWMALDRISMA